MSEPNKKEEKLNQVDQANQTQETIIIKSGTTFQKIALLVWLLLITILLVISIDIYIRYTKTEQLWFIIILLLSLLGTIATINNNYTLTINTKNKTITQDVVIGKRRIIPFSHILKVKITSNKYGLPELKIKTTNKIIITVQNNMVKNFPEIVEEIYNNLKTERFIKESNLDTYITHIKVQKHIQEKEN